MDLLPGLMVLTASLEGFSPAVVEVQISDQPSAQSVTISLSPKLDPHTEMRLVMNWGHLPSDLDLHVLQIDRFKSKIPGTKTDFFILGILVQNVKPFLATRMAALVSGLMLTTLMVRCFFRPIRHVFHMLLFRRGRRSRDDNMG